MIQCMAKPLNTATRDQLIAGSQAALKNAHRLVRDAEALLKGGSAPTAHSLAILALEEASKSHSWVQAAGEMAGDVEVEVPSLAIHAEKLEKARSVWKLIEDHFDGAGKTPMEEIIAQAKVLAKNDNVAKQRGFYVDLEAGVVKDPSSIGSEEATEMIEMVEGLIGLALIGALYQSSRKPSQ
jgi:AbiV family abortive infection protein